MARGELSDNYEGRGLRLSAISKICRTIAGDYSQFSFKVIRSSEDLQKTFDIINKRYADVGKISRGQTIDPFRFIYPGNRILLVEFDKKPVSTATFQRDSDLGLDIDRYFPFEIQNLRKDISYNSLINIPSGLEEKFKESRKKYQSKLVEVIGLADVAQNGEKMKTLYGLMSLIYKFSTLDGASHIVQSCIPESVPFYESHWGFQRIGEAESRFGGRICSLKMDLDKYQKFVSGQNPQSRVFPELLKLMPHEISPLEDLASTEPISPAAARSLLHTGNINYLSLQPEHVVRKFCDAWQREGVDRDYWIK